MKAKELAKAYTDMTNYISCMIEEQLTEHISEKAINQYNAIIHEIIQLCGKEKEVADLKVTNLKYAFQYETEICEQFCLKQGFEKDIFGDWQETDSDIL